MKLKQAFSVILVCFMVSVSISALADGHQGNVGGHKNTGITVAPYNARSYSITLVEHGLPPGMLWYAFIGPHNQSYYSSTPLRSNGKTITYNEQPGSYAFSIGANGPYITKKLNIYATVVNTSVTVNVYFMKLINVTVTARGIPYGTNWEFDLVPENTTSYSGSPYGGSQISYVFNYTMSMMVPNGTYALKAGEAINLGLSFTGDVGKVVVNGTPVEVTLNFSRVNITASDLPAGVEWGNHYSYVTAYPNGTQINPSGWYPGTSGNMTLYLPRGNFSFHPVAAGYYSNSLNFSVTGKSLNLTVRFEKGYRVTIIEHGLPDIGDNYWGVSGFPVAYGSSATQFSAYSSISYLVPNGTYELNTSGIPNQWNINGSLYQVGINLTNADRNFTVNGSSLEVNLYFNTTIISRISGSNPVSTIGRYLEVAVVGIVLAAITGTIVMYYRQRKK